jgi:hypothetical protein
MKIQTKVFLLLFIPAFLHAQMKEPYEWVGYEKVMGVKNGLRHYDYDVKTIFSSAPANVFWPGEQVRFIFQLTSNIDEPVRTEGRVQIISYGSKGIPGDVWWPEMYKVKDIETIPLSLDVSPNGYTDIEITPQAPERFGGYAVVFDLGKYGRRLATSFVKSMKPAPVKTQYPKQSLDDLGVDFLNRVGVQAIRYEVSYSPTTFRDYQRQMRKLDDDMKRYNDNNITVMHCSSRGVSKW